MTIIIVTSSFSVGIALNLESQSRHEAAKLTMVAYEISTVYQGGRSVLLQSWGSSCLEPDRLSYTTI